jgi:hypothetical protein
MYEVETRMPSGTVQGVEAYECSSLVCGWGQPDRIVTRDLDRDRFISWYRDGKFRFELPVADYVLAQYLLRYRVLNEGRPATASTDTAGKGLVPLLEQTSAFIMSERDARPDQPGTESDRIPEVVVGWNWNRDAVSQYLNLHLRFENGNRKVSGMRTKVLKVLGRDDIVLRTVYVAPFGRKALTPAQLTELVGKITGPSHKLENPAAWSAFLGDGYVILEDQDPGMYREVRASAQPRKLDSLFQIPSERPICGNRGSVQVSMENSTAAVTCREAARSGYLIIKALLDNGTEYRPARIERRIELGRDEVLNLPLPAGQLADGQYNLQATLDGEPIDIPVTIGQILQNPQQFKNRTVLVEGEVTMQFSVYLLQYFRLRDNSGEIHVICHTGLPARGAKVRVRGHVGQYSFGPYAADVIFADSWEPTVSPP